MNIDKIRAQVEKDLQSCINLRANLLADPVTKPVVEAFEKAKSDDVYALFKTNLDTLSGCEDIYGFICAINRTEFALINSATNRELNLNDVNSDNYLSLELRIQEDGNMNLTDIPILFEKMNGFSNIVNEYIKPEVLKLLEVPKITCL